MKNNWFKQKTSIDEGVSNKNENPSESEIKSACLRKHTAQPRNNNTPITVLFVPRTVGGELARKLRQAEEEIEKITGDRIKIVERAGTMLKRILHKSNPWAGGPCGRVDCLVCKHEKGGGNCKRRNVTYKTECQTCREKSGKERIYVGETARTAYERGLEHGQDFRTGKDDSHMHKHWLEEHQDEEMPEFSMKVIRPHTSAFVRQVHEAVCIEMHASKTLNSKGEFNRCQLPRLGVKMGERDVGCDKAKIELTENDIFQAISENHKRKESVWQGKHLGQPAAKKRKIRPEICQNEPNSEPANSSVGPKRKRESEPIPEAVQSRNIKRTRIEVEAIKCLHPSNNSSWEAASISDKKKSEDNRSENPAPNIGNICKNEENVHGSPIILRKKNIRKFSTSSSKQNSEKSVQEITSFIEYKPRETLLENKMKIVAGKSEKFTKNKLSIQEITAFFEKKLSGKSGVSKVGGEDKSKNKANTTSSPRNQTPTTSTRHQIKKRIKSKLIPPATLTISELFSKQKTRVKTNTGQNSDQMKQLDSPEVIKASSGS